MKNLKTLIKIRKNNINSIMKRIETLLQHREILEQKFVGLMAQMNYETEKFNATEFGFALDVFLSGARRKKAEYINGLGLTEKNIEESRSFLQDEFNEMKKLEIVLKKREKKEREIEESLEEQDIDDIYIMQHNRKAN